MIISINAIDPIVIYTSANSTASNIKRRSWTRNEKRSTWKKCRNALLNLNLIRAKIDLETKIINVKMSKDSIVISEDSVLLVNIIFNLRWKEERTWVRTKR